MLILKDFVVIGVGHYDSDEAIAKWSKLLEDGILGTAIYSLGTYVHSGEVDFCPCDVPIIGTVGSSVKVSNLSDTSLSFNISKEENTEGGLLCIPGKDLIGYIDTHKDWDVNDFAQQVAPLIKKALSEFGLGMKLSLVDVNSAVFKDTYNQLYELCCYEKELDNKIESGECTEDVARANSLNHSNKFIRDYALAIKDSFKVISNDPELRLMEAMGMLKV